MTSRKDIVVIILCFYSYTTCLLGHMTTNVLLWEYIAWKSWDAGRKIGDSQFQHLM